MMGAASIERFQKRWQQSKYMEALLYAIGFGGLVYLLTHHLIYGVIGFIVSAAIAVFVLRPWSISQENAVSYIDAHLPQAGFSSGLLLSPSNELSDLSKLQQYRVASQLEPILSKLRPPQNLLKATLIMFALILLGLAGRFVFSKVGNSLDGNKSTKEQITFSPKDSLSTSIEIPELTGTKITVRYPSYTGKSALTGAANLTGAIRGSNGTTAATHSSADAVTQHATGMDNILEVNYRITSTSVDSPMTEVSRSQYQGYSNKTAKGTPTSYFVQRFIDRTTLTLYLTPGAAQDGNKINLYYVRRIQDAGAYGNATNVPYRFAPCMTAGLAFYLSQKNVPQRSQELKLFYEDELARAIKEDADITSTYIAPKVYYPNA